MIEAALALIEYLLKLLQLREESLDEYFELYIQPAYESAELVFNDFLNLLQSVRRKIEQDNPPEEIIKFLEESRIKYLSIRMRLRAEINNRWPLYKQISLEYENKFGELTPFERGIIGLLVGGLAPSEDTGYYVNLPYPGPGHYPGRHTLLDLLYRFSEYSNNNKIKNRYLETVDLQIDSALVHE